MTPAIAKALKGERPSAGSLEELANKAALPWVLVHLGVPQLNSWIGSLPTAPPEEWRQEYEDLLQEVAHQAWCGDRRGWMRAIKLLRRWIESDAQLRPDAARGLKFRPKGRGESPVKRYIRKILLKDPAATPSQVWRELAARPPRGIQVWDNRVGKYLEYISHSKLHNMDYPRFQNAVGEVRRALKDPTG